jgi:beta-glucosidase
MMTLDEKLGQLTQFSGFAATTGPGASEANPDQLRQGRVGSFLNVSGVEGVRHLQKIAVDETRLHIPLVFGLDVIHGMRTIFPIPLAEASTWNPAAVEEAARIAAREASAYGIDWTFAPMVDIARDARWGRITEGSGEDPYLGSVMAAARVRGFQGGDLRAPDRIAATAKHFAAYGGAEGGRDYNVVDASERSMRELYLPPFHAAACAGAATFMASFNEIAGVPAHANRWLLTDVLRGEWGFRGAVVSDWAGVGELIPHGVAADSAEAARRGIEAGVDIEMVSGTYAAALPQLVRSGVVSMATIDESVRRVLRLKQRLGLFEDPYRRMDPRREQTDILTPAHRAAARNIAQQSIVLLRNEHNTLPLSKNIHSLAVIGALAADTVSALGSWAGMGRPRDAVSVLEGIRKAVSGRTHVVYERGTGPLDTGTAHFRSSIAAARNADAIILVVGEPRDMSGEAESRSSIDLPGSQLRLAQRLHALGKPLVVVLMNGRPLTIPWLAENASALVESWFLGVETGNAVADVLFGDVNPSGKLTATFPRAVGQIPIYYNHRRTGRPPSPTDKYTSKYIDLPSTPLYPFGYGLGYTTYAYTHPRLSTTNLNAGDSLFIDLTVRNTGSRDGEEIVQLYVGDEAASVTRPIMELRRFQRVALRAGESKTVRFTIGMDDLALYDAHMKRVAEPGWFRVYTGGNSRDVQDARFKLSTPDDKPIAVPESCH